MCSILLQEGLERHGVVALCVLRGVEQRHPALARTRKQVPPKRLMGGELLAVARLKLRPARGIVTEPAPQLVTRRDIFKPEVDARAIALKTTRPQAIDQHAITVFGRGRIVRAFEL